MAFFSSPFGLLLAFIVTVIVGSFLWNTWQNWNRDIDAANQDAVFRHPTGVVPADVVSRAGRARVRRMVWIGVAAIGVYYGFVRPRSPDNFKAIEDALKGLLVFVLGVLADILTTLQQWLAGSA